MPRYTIIIMNALRKENASLKRQLKYKDGARRAGFAMFYASENKLFERNMEVKDLTKRLLEENKEVGGMPTHIENELKELYKLTKKDCSCPICLDDLEKDTMLFSSCGHLYCPTCYTTLVNQTNPKCAICRKKIYPKKD